MSNKMDIFERRMVNINGDLQERVIYQRHMAEDMFIDASGIVEGWIEIWASGIINESYVLTSPATQVANPHYTYSFDVNLTPDVSGVRDLGTVSNAFNEAYIDSVFLEEDPTYPLEAATKQYVDASVHMNEFIELVDTPSSYSGMAASGVRVTAGEDGLEFCDLASANTLQSVTDNGNVTTNYIEIGGSLTSGDVTPTPSGALDCGWQDQTWHAGYFDNLYAYILYGNVLNLGTTNITSASGLMVLTDASGSFTLGDLYGGGAGGSGFPGGVPTGSYLPYGGNTEPSGWLYCNGQAVSRATYSDLFTAISTRYGHGDGSTTFNVPDMRGNAAVGLDNMGGASAGRITDSEADSTGGAYGTEDHTLVISEMAAHKHNVKYTNAGGAGYSPEAESPLRAAITAGSPPTLTSWDTSHYQMDDAGGDGAHNNVQPSLFSPWIIKT